MANDQLPNHLRELAMRVAKHEMGHYVVARSMGFRTGEVSVEIIGPINGHRGGAALTLPERINSLEELQVYLQRRVIVLYAGGAAETLPGRGAPEKKVDADEACKIIRDSGRGAEQDHAKTRELIHVLRNVAEPATDPFDTNATQEELNELDGKLFARAIEIVEQHADTIIGLAENLASRVKQVNVTATLKASYLEGLPAVKAIAVVAPFENDLQLR